MHRAWATCVSADPSSPANLTNITDSRPKRIDWSMQTKSLVEFCLWRYLRIGVWCSLKKACDNPSFVQSLCRIVRRYGLINIQKWQSMFSVLVRDVLHNVFFRSVHSFVITRSLNPILFPVNFSVREETIKSRKVWFFSLLCFPVLEKCDLTLSLDVRCNRSSPLFKKERRKIAISVIYPWLWDCHFQSKKQHDQ